MKKGVDYIGVGTGALIFNKNDEVFITRRGPKARNEAGKWDFPGGSVNFGERCEDAAVREIKEEFNIDIEITEFLEVVDHIITKENQHWVSPTFIAKYIGGEPKIMEPDKCTAFKWVKLNKINPHKLTIASSKNYQTYCHKYGTKPPINKVSLSANKL